LLPQFINHKLFLTKNYTKINNNKKIKIKMPKQRASVSLLLLQGTVSIDRKAAKFWKPPPILWQWKKLVGERWLMKKGE
jgi:hypothetical protein